MRKTATISISCFITLVLLFVAPASALAKKPVGVGDYAPLLDLDTLAQTRVSMRKLIGNPLVLVVGRTRKSAPRCKKWMAALLAAYPKKPLVYQVVVANKSWYIPRGAVRSKLRSIVGPNHHERFLIEWYTVFAKQYGITKHDHPVIYVIDKKGVIRWTYIGEFAKDKWQALKKAISSYC
jgi:peroxiredoxin